MVLPYINCFTCTALNSFFSVKLTSYIFIGAAELKVEIDISFHAYI